MTSTSLLKDDGEVVLSQEVITTHDPRTSWEGAIVTMSSVILRICKIISAPELVYAVVL